MNSAFLEVSLVLLIANGAFAMTEIAIVASRKGLLQSMADKGNKGAARVLGLSENPNRFLSTVQIGISLVGIVAGALGSGTVATRLAEILEVVPVIGFEKFVAHDIMIPRSKIFWIEREAKYEDVWPQIMLPPVVVPETQGANVLLETFHKSGQRAVFVIDEFGSVMGMVTLIDLMETILGDVTSVEVQLTMPVKQREDGSRFIDGLFQFEKLPERFEGFILSEGGGDNFQTVSGWFMNEIGRVPVENDRITTGEWTFEVAMYGATLR